MHLMQLVQRRQTMKFNFYSDPEHGWLRVPIEWLYELGIYESISKFSYVSDNGKWVYLEEDLDAQIFIDAYTITRFHAPAILYSPPSNNRSSIRSYRSYDESIKAQIRTVARQLDDNRA